MNTVVREPAVYGGPVKQLISVAVAVSSIILKNKTIPHLEIEIILALAQIRQRLNLLLMNHN